MKLLGCLSVLGIAFISQAMAYESAFEKTEIGVIEVKTIPAGKLLVSKGEGSYFDQSNRLFGPLFSYIQSNDISMTVPVEARIDPGAMYFWVAEAEVEKASESTEQVKVIDVPERLVAVIGGKGAYRESNFKEAREKLMNWLEKEGNELWRPTGQAYAVYWDGPFTLWFMKEYEVQIEVERVEPMSDS